MSHTAPPEPPIDEKASVRLDGFLDALASRTPTPGGGAAAGMCGAIACALAEMVAGYSVAKAATCGGGQVAAPVASSATNASPPDPAQDILARLSVCRRMLRQLMDEDAVAYEAMTAARRGAKADPNLKRAFESAVLAATRVPMEIMATGATTLALMDELKDRASRFLLSDLGAAAVMALAAVRAADYSVRVNLPGLPEGTAQVAADEADRILDRAARLAEGVEALVREALRRV
ncbi:MAG: cyclodeaminase/cyclohydrolase family protein [Phycisphaerales bacterium]|nr:cyclodeaminase/cyclohydrolase family protein [Phycisphaerales bacterium]